MPEFVGDRLSRIQIMIDMVQDKEWRLPDEETTRVVNALAYFGEPEDLIPDHIPGLGFLDDAIMVELVVRELRHEIDAYADFCRFRSVEEKRRGGRGAEDEVTREEWLAVRRKELQSRMRNRRLRERTRRGTKSSRSFTLHACSDDRRRGSRRNGLTSQTTHDDAGEAQDRSPWPRPTA